MEVRFYLDPDTGEPHIFEHGVTEEEKLNMTSQQFPPGWDAQRVKRLLAQSEGVDEEQQVAEDEQALRGENGQTVIAVPADLLPAIRKLIAEHTPS